MIKIKFQSLLVKVEAIANALRILTLPDDVIKLIDSQN